MMMRSLCTLLPGVLLIVLLPIGPASAAAGVRLDSDTDVATAGYFRLSWQASDASTRLVEATDPEFVRYRVIYSGPDTARLISGKPDGDYYYRLETADGDTDGRARVLSNVKRVTVAHHPLGRAFFFFAVGAIVFVATLGLVLVGGRATSSEP